MIPVSLTIKGLYSYQAEQTIQFDRLMEGQLFGIFGSVGSGKSSILEAISFVLYAETERLNKTDNRNYNMMNLKSSELLIDFTFKNHDDKHYRYVVRGKRHGKKFEQVGTFDRSAYVQEDGQWLPLENTHAEEVIGLSYDNFRRTIIIPQGKFQEFLQLGEKDRNNMLKEIFGLEKYEFFNQTTALQNRNNEAIHRLEGELRQFDNCTEETLRAASAAEKELAEQYKAHQLLLNLKEKDFKLQEALQQLFSELEQAKASLSNLEAQAGEFQAYDQKIKDAEYCQKFFKHALQHKKEAEAAVSKREQAIAGINGQLRLCREALALKSAEFENVKAAYGKLEAEKIKLKDYELLLRVLELQKDIKLLDDRLGKGQGLTREALSAKETAGMELESLKKALKKEKALMPDLLELGNVRNWFNSYGSLQQQQALVTQEQEQLTDQKKELQEKFEKIAAHALLVSLNRDQSIVAYLEGVDTLKQQAAVHTVELNQEYHHLQVQTKLGEFADQLKDGGTCPLCGADHHPKLFEATEVNRGMAEVTEQLTRIQSEVLLFDQLSVELKGLQHQTGFLDVQNTQLGDRRQKLQEEIIALKARFTWASFSPDDEAAVNEAIKNAEAQRQMITILEESADKQEELFQEFSKKYDQYLTAMRSISEELNIKKGQANIFKDQIADLSSMPDDAEQVNKAIQELRIYIELINTRHEQLGAQLNKTQQEEAILAAKLGQELENLKAEASSLKDKAGQLEAQLMASPYANWETVQKILAADYETETMRTALLAYQQQSFSAKQRFEELSLKTLNREFDLAKFDQLKAELETFKARSQQLNEQYIAAKAALDRQQGDLAAKLSLTGKLTKLQERAANISVLSKLFRAPGFVGYISGVYLNQLCAAANERFYQLSRQQLRLEITGKNEFYVRDYLNNGKLRNVKTLSGGQTFQASLSLALALAESVQQQTRSKQNFFFLDEGFGSLDKESLQVAFETLKSLRRENRIVGVISHVEELQQEIDVYLNVVNDTFTGSKIRGSWE